MTSTWSATGSGSPCTRAPARTAPPRGSFRFRHLLPDGKLLSIGHADVTCLQVSGDTALLTAHVTREHILPAPPGLSIGPHAFYVKIIDGGAGDRIVFSQANNPPPGTTLPRECIDVEAKWPGLLKRYAIERGDYAVR